jgi:putative ABC transport system permease protein
MPDWRAYVRDRIRLPAMSPEREEEIVEELAAQLDDVFRDALNRGAGESDAIAAVEAHVPDWAALSREVSAANRRHRVHVEVRMQNDLEQKTFPGRLGNMIAWLAADFLYAVRVLRKSPGFALAATLTLGLGIGATTSLFSVVHAVLLRPLPFDDPERLVRLISLRADQERGGISYPDFLDWKAQSDVFERMAVFVGRDAVLTQSGQASHVRAAAVSAELFGVLGASALAGRTFAPGEDTPGAAGGANAVVLSHRLWRERFGADPRIVGGTIDLDRAKSTVVGVMPVGFQFPIAAERIDLWTTMAVYAATNTAGESMTTQRGVHFLDGIARLKPDVTLRQAQDQLSALVARLNQQYPDDARGILVLSESSELVAKVRFAWLALLGATACLLLIACANVAGLLLARASSRRPELAVRTALGAGRGRLILQLLMEHTMLAVVGGLLGFSLAYWGTMLLKLLAPEDVPRISEVSLDGPVMVFAAAATMLTVALFGVGPAFHASRFDLVRSMKLGGRGQTNGGSHHARRLLVVGQVAVALVLLVGGGLLFKSLMRLYTVNPGLDPTHILSFQLDLPSEYTPARERSFYEQLIPGLRSLPGVRSASAVLALPLSGMTVQTSFRLEGEPATEPHQHQTSFNVVEPDYFRTLGIPILKGRDFTARDDLKSVPVVIVNERFARQFFAGQDPLGQRIRPGIGNGYKDEPLREIVGVVGGVRAADLKTEPVPEAYLPGAQCPSIGSAAVVLRTTGEPEDITRGARHLVAALDSSIPVHDVKTLEQYLARWVVQPRFNSLLLGMFAALSVTLAAVGLYGLIGYTVARRTHEVGIRLALGATPTEVLTLILRQGVATALSGIVIGVLAALVLARWISTLLYEVSPLDPLIFAGAAILLLCVALVACFLPARRAMRVDPMAALRFE